MTSPRTLAAARAMCKRFAADAGADVEVMWNTCKHTLIADARAAIEAVDAIPLTVVGPPKPRKKHEMIRKHIAMQASVIEQLQAHKATLEETVRIYREKYGVLGGSSA